MKMLHALFVLLSFVSFTGRFYCLFAKPEIFQEKLVKILPHVIDSLLLLSGIALVIQGDWFSVNASWLVTKLLFLAGYIVLAAMAMKKPLPERWWFFAGAMASFFAVYGIAVTKFSLF